MENLIVRRHSQNCYGTVSTVIAESTGRFLFFFLEPTIPIPAGKYHVVWCNHPLHKMCYELKNVPGHTGILIHTGNGVADTKCCLIPGLELGLYQTPSKFLTFGVLYSKKAYAKLLALQADTSMFDITIIDDFVKVAA